ncbi:MAG: zinc ribbon domain-containing protein [Candidatus Xenobiia bacterium LiM19]
MTVSELLCPSCGGTLEVGARFCVDCGAEVPAVSLVTHKLAGKCTTVLEDMAEKLPCSDINPEADDTADVDKKADNSSEAAQDKPVSETLCISQIPAAPLLCPSCKKPVTSGIQFCGDCGARMTVQIKPAEPEQAPSVKKTCLSCMAENDSDSIFCRNCGTEIPQPENPENTEDNEAVSGKSISHHPPCRQKPLTTSENSAPAALKTDSHKKMLQYGVIIIIVLAVILAIVSLKKKPEITPSNPVYNGSSQTDLTPPPDIDQNSRQSEELIKVLHNNYNSVNNKDFDRVYNLRSERLRRKNSPEYYREIYQENLSIEINEAHVQELGSIQAKVAVNLTSFDIFNGVKIRSVHTGWFLLVKEQNRWLIDDSGLKLIDQTQVNQ